MSIRYASLSKKLRESCKPMSLAGSLSATRRKPKPAVVIVTNIETLPPPETESPFGGFSFRLPWAPSVNNAYANNKVTGGRFKVKRAKVFCEQAILAMIEQKVPRNALKCPLAITITQHTCSDQGDVDNGIKAVLDTIKVHGVILDDCRKIVKRVTVQDGFRVKKGEQYIEIRIESLLRWT